MKQNIVYMQVIKAQQPSPASKRIKQIQDMTHLPKPQKLIQQSSTKPAAKVFQKPPERNTPVSEKAVSTPTSHEASETPLPTQEALVDLAARCQIPELTMTQDAANAGVTSGKIILQVQIDQTGQVVAARLLKGTGFKIDDEVRQLALTIKCTPAQKDGKNVSVLKRLQWTIVR